jgi:hypothetical protein
MCELPVRFDGDVERLWQRTQHVKPERGWEAYRMAYAYGLRQAVTGVACVCGARART